MAGASTPGSNPAQETGLVFHTFRPIGIDKSNATANNQVAQDSSKRAAGEPDCDVRLDKRVNVGVPASTT